MAVRSLPDGDVDLTTSPAPLPGAAAAADPAASDPAASDPAGARALARALGELRRGPPGGRAPLRSGLAGMVAAAAGVETAACVVPAGRGWRLADDALDGLGARVALLPPESAEWTASRLVPGAGLIFVPVRPGALAVVLEPAGAAAGRLALLDVAAGAAELAVGRAEGARDAGILRSEIAALENVAGEILSVHNLDQVLLSITHRTRHVLDADMSGVLFREGDELVMRCCTGNRSAETARLRMRAGQGLAGRVLATGRPCRVDSYLRADTITHDFNPLAETEGARSALGVPLAARGEVIGVLEVWRRRRSVFSDRHERMLVALASLATMAIENAGLYERQRQHVAELARAHDSLSRQIQVLQQSASLQRSLIQLLLDGEGLPAIARTIAALVGGRAAVFSEALEPLAAYPHDLPVDAVRAELRALGRRAAVGSGTVHLAMPAGRGGLAVQAIRAGPDRLGWFCLLTDEAPGGTGVEIAVGEAALSCALCLLEQQAASLARVQARDEILRDLLEGTNGYRQAALARAKRMHIDLSPPQRVLHCSLDGLEEGARAEGWDGPRLERARRDLAGMAQRLLAGTAGSELFTVRGDAIVALVPGGERPPAERLLASFGEELGRLLPWVRPAWGVSAVHTDPAEYGLAGTEAQIALRAARRMGGERTAFFDELGVVRLLLASDDTDDLARYVNEVIGPLVEQDRRHGTPFTETLLVYFDSNCSQQEAARRLYVHPNTLRYRLGRIAALTGLDLRRHDVRVRTDLALRIHQVISAHRRKDDPR